MFATLSKNEIGILIMKIYLIDFISNNLTVLVNKGRYVEDHELNLARNPDSCLCVTYLGMTWTS